MIEVPGAAIPAQDRLLYPNPPKIGGAASAPRLLKAVLLNPVMISTLAGLAWSAIGLPLPTAATTFLGIFAGALKPCALFAIGLGLALDDFRGLVRAAAVMTALKPVVLPPIVLLLARICGLGRVETLLR